MAKKVKFYVVWRGHRPGVYSDWATAKAQIEGFSGASFKSFSTRAEAENALRGGPPARGAAPARGSGKRTKVNSRQNIIWRSLSVDAACSGNPGPMEYQGVDTKTKERIFHQQFPLGTNNIGEFLAIVHGLALLQKQHLPELPIYTDSATAQAWVRNKKVKTNLVRNNRTEPLWQLIERGEEWLKNNTWRNPILKWDTDNWGEIPADFGRK